MAKKTLKFNQITTEQFLNYFALEGPGYVIARAADRAGEIGSPIQAVEAVCLGNQLYVSNLTNRLMTELHPLGKVKEYFALEGTARADFAVEVLGKERATQILKDVMAESLAEARIGENEKHPADE